VRVTVDVRGKVKENWLARVFPFSGKWRQKDFGDMQEVEVPLNRSVPVTELELFWKRWVPWTQWNILPQVRFFPWITDFADSMVTRNELDEVDKSIEVSCNKS
jgi:hypothetical protein